MYSFMLLNSLILHTTKFAISSTITLVAYSYPLANYVYGRTKKKMYSLRNMRKICDERANTRLV